jgi:hypothetical protein
MPVVWVLTAIGFPTIHRVSCISNTFVVDPDVNPWYPVSAN